MKFFILIVIAILIFLVLWIRNKFIYNKYFKPNYIFFSQLVHTYNVNNCAPNLKLLEASDNFFNYTANLILKLIHFTVFAAITYFVNIYFISLILIIIYVIFTYMSWFVYKNRKNFYKEISHFAYREAFEPIFKASICIPIFQTVIWILLIIA